MENKLEKILNRKKKKVGVIITRKRERKIKGGFRGNTRFEEGRKIKKME